MGEERTVALEVVQQCLGKKDRKSQEDKSAGLRRAGPEASGERQRGREARSSLNHSRLEPKWPRPPQSASLSLSVSLSSSPGHEGSVKPPGQLAPQIVIGALSLSLSLPGIGVGQDPRAPKPTRYVLRHPCAKAIFILQCESRGDCMLSKTHARVNLSRSSPLTSSLVSLGLRSIGENDPDEFGTSLLRLRGSVLHSPLFLSRAEQRVDALSP